MLTATPATWLWLVAPRGAPSPDAAPPPFMVVEINSAPPLALLALPGLGPTRVHRIQTARDERPIASLDDLARRVKGIGPATIEGIRPYVRVDAPPDDGPPARPSR
ncbi:helix-hairpin-helix domain-containing protein [Tautonia sp. JC769]|uniref:helix-hairpin-helix domain-containing protein n=1 Tax=Tautonia sp. JC769 TaxID=3232135 RepID=UPI00345AC735